MECIQECVPNVVLRGLDLQRSTHTTGRSNFANSGTVNIVVRHSDILQSPRMENQYASGMVAARDTMKAARAALTIPCLLFGHMAGDDVDTYDVMHRLG